MIYIGVDNGVTGLIGIIDTETNEVRLLKIPVKSELSYTKKKQNITRIDFDKLSLLLTPYKDKPVKVAIERPMVNPKRFKATASALRALEALLIIVEQMKFSYCYCDSKEWQRKLLPKGLKKEDLKADSLCIAKRLYPQVDYGRFKDADGLLIAEWLRAVYAVNV